MENVGLLQVTWRSCVGKASRHFNMQLRSFVSAPLVACHKMSRLSCVLVWRWSTYLMLDMLVLLVV